LKTPGSRSSLKSPSNSVDGRHIASHIASLPVAFFEFKKKNLRRIKLLVSNFEDVLELDPKLTKLCEIWML